MLQEKQRVTSLERESGEDGVRAQVRARARARARASLGSQLKKILKGL